LAAQVWHGAHDVPLPKYPELHTHAFTSDCEPTGHDAVALALASHCLH